MLSESLQKALNEQINAELASAYLYLSMSGYCESQNLKGMAGWFRVQVQEELFHASKFFDYVNDRGGRVILTQIGAPASEWASPRAVFDETYRHEQKVTALIAKIAGLAAKEGDFATSAFLQWFLNEQIEEEATASQIAGQLALIGDDRSGLYLLDQKLGERVFVMPAAGAGTAAGG